MLSGNLPTLHVLIPMLAAVLCAITKKGSSAWLISCIASFATLAVCINLFTGIGDNYISYFFGGWGIPQNYDYPVGIEYRIDALNGFVLLIIATIAAIIAPYAKSSIASEIPKSKQSLFYTMYLICLTGLLGMTTTGDIFNIYVFLEISSLSTYAMIAMGKDRRALLSAFEYLILGTIGATFLLIGVGLLYLITGTLNIADMAKMLEPIEHSNPVLLAAFAFLTLGVGLKIALFPLHIWLTNAYAYAPSFASSFLASTATKVMMYIFIRIIFTLFGYDFIFNELPVTESLVALAVAGIIVGSIVAIYQNNVKKLLAFSSIAQLGYIILALAIATESGLAASLIHIANHAFAKGLLFLCVGGVILRTGGCNINNFRGVAQYMPYTMAAFVVGGISIIGIPLTAGFISKWYLISALIAENYWWLIILLLASSLMAVIYIWKIVEVAYFAKVEGDNRAITEAPILMQISIWVMVAVNIYLGLDSSIVTDNAEIIAENLFL